MNRPDKQPQWFELAAVRTKSHFTGDSDLAAATERRVIEAVTRRKRAPKALWLLPITLIGSGSLAWAEEVERAVQWTVEQVQELVQTEVAPTETTASASADAKATSSRQKHTPTQSASTPVPEPELVPAAQPSPADAELVEPVVSAPSESELAASAARALNGRRPSHNGVEVASTRLNAPASTPSDLERYRAGHVAQYERADYGAALLAWDAYLQHVPGGRFTPEVRYNRALALVELGRKQEAIAALAPFAAGAYGPLRQQSASKLIRRLGSE